MLFVIRSGDTSVPLATARAVAVAHGVECDDAVVIASGSNVLVHLKPAPLVARVMVGTAVLHDDVSTWLQREVAVGVFVAERGGPIVPPSDLLPPGPYQHDGIWMTFWTFVPHDLSDVPPDAREVGRSLRELHRVLADFSGELGSLAGVRNDIERQLAEVRPCSWLSALDIDLLRYELQRLTPAVFETCLPTQPLHGDVSLSNVLCSRPRLLWNDLEDVCAGPIRWDVAGLVTSARARERSDKYVDEMLSAYGGPGLDDLDAFVAAHGLYAAVWQTFDVQRRSCARTTAPRGLAQWREQLVH
jgi:hypothetical protein